MWDVRRGDGRGQECARRKGYYRLGCPVFANPDPSCDYPRGAMVMVCVGCCHGESPLVIPSLPRDLGL